MSASRASRRKGGAGPTLSLGVGEGSSGSSSLLGQQGNQGKERTLAKLWTPNEDWEKDELCDVIYWIRQVLGLVCGVIWGLVPLSGAIPLFGFGILNTGLVFGYYSQVLKVDDEEFGGTWALMQEGLMPSIALFLLSWVLVYTTLHFS